MSGKAWLGYCGGGNAGFWTLSIEEDGEAHDPCRWRARSSESISFDILDTLSYKWFAKVTNGDREVPMQHLEMSAYGGGDQNECGGHGSFGNEKCECKAGRFGLNCEFVEPCESLALDIRREGFLSEGTRELPSSYDIFRTKSNETMEVYDRPVFFNNKNNQGRFAIIMFVGRRWVLFEKDEDGLEEYLLDFHAHFSSFDASFITEPMDVGTPADASTLVGLEWFLTLPTNKATPQSQSHYDGIQSDSTRPSDAILLCAVCHNLTNVCQNNGKCQNDSSCTCDLGSTGRLCEKPPLGNGRCDSFFNYPEFNFDGGDCCEPTCVSSSKYFCGKDATGYGDIGYPSCKQLAVNHWAPNSIPIPGSKTLAYSGASVSLSGNGAMLAIGEHGMNAVRLLSKDGSKWIDQELLEGPPGSGFGSVVVMSSGSTNVVNNPSKRAPVTIAIAAPASRSGNYNGMARVYDCKNLRCIKVGEDILGTQLGFGHALAMSGNGELLAVSDSPDIGYDEGDMRVRVYHLPSNLEVVYDIKPVRNMRSFGVALSLSANGALLAVGSYTSSERFIVHMYKRMEGSYVYDEAENVNKWIEGGYAYANAEIETGILQPALQSALQPAVALSSDTMVLAIGSTFDEIVPGAEVYQWTPTDSKWT
jgi:hypothetical protein